MKHARLAAGLVVGTAIVPGTAREATPLGQISGEVGATRIVRADDRLCATFRTGSTAGVLGCVAGSTFQIDSTVPLPSAPAEPLSPPSELPPIPQSAYDDFARARPARVANNYRRNSTVIDETVGAWQRVGNRIWFGKTFYDGEGRTGVGGLGVFDTVTGQFSLIAPPEIADWSTSALLIEGDIAWVGLVRHPEGADYGNGLLRVDLTKRIAERIDVPDIVTGVVRLQGARYLATTNGIYVVGDRTLRRFRVASDRQGGWAIVADELPRHITIRRV